MQNLENLQQAKQTESYTATVSHEMRTPLSQVLFMLEKIMTTISTLPDSESTSAAKRHGKLIRSQLEFMQLFVEDLLNLKMLNDGVFKLV